MAKELVNAVGEFIGGRRVDDFLRWRGQHELLIRVGQRVVRDEGSDVAEFRRVRLEKFLARGNAVKEIGDADRRSRGQARRLHVYEFSAGKFQPRALGFRFVARFEEQPRDRGNRWQRFAAKTQRRNRKQIVSGFQFARGVALESQQCVVVNHPVAVIDHANHALAADFGFNADGLRASVQRIFQQLFHYRSRTFDNFARSDFVCDSFRQYPNSTHARRLEGVGPSGPTSITLDSWNPDCQIGILFPRTL